MNSIYLHRNHLEAIIQFMDAVNPNYTTVEIISENTSGIGSTITAKIHGHNMNGMIVNIEREIVNENDW